MDEQVLEKVPAQKTRPCKSISRWSFFRGKQIHVLVQASRIRVGISWSFEGYRTIITEVLKIKTKNQRRHHSNRNLNPLISWQLQLEYHKKLQIHFYIMCNSTRFFWYTIGEDTFRIIRYNKCLHYHVFAGCEEWWKRRKLWSIFNRSLPWSKYLKLQEVPIISQIYWKSIRFDKSRSLKLGIRASWTAKRELNKRN